MLKVVPTAAKSDAHHYSHKNGECFGPKQAQLTPIVYTLFPIVALIIDILMRLIAKGSIQDRDDKQFSTFQL